MVTSSGFSPSTFFATAAALIQNKTVLDMRNRSQLHQLPGSSEHDLHLTPVELNKMSLGEYHHPHSGKTHKNS